MIPHIKFLKKTHEFDYVNTFSNVIEYEFHLSNKFTTQIGNMFKSSQEIRENILNGTLVMCMRISGEAIRVLQSPRTPLRNFRSFWETLLASVPGCCPPLPSRAPTRETRAYTKYSTRQRNSISFHLKPHILFLQITNEPESPRRNKGKGRGEGKRHRTTHQPR